MDVEIEQPHVHHRKTGIRRLDLILPLAALFISVLSILIAWHHGKVMSDLVHQNERLVEAESLPYLQIEMSNLESDLHSPALRLTVQNQGVGPARIAEVVMTVNGEPVRDFNTLIDHCCAPGFLQTSAVGKKQFRGLHNGEIVLTKLRDRMIRPGEAVDAFDWPITPENRPILDRLRAQYATNALNTAICYCSVFHECWIRTDEDRQPVPIRQCTPAHVSYEQ